MSGDLGGQGMVPLSQSNTVSRLPGGSGETFHLVEPPLSAVTTTTSVPVRMAEQRKIAHILPAETMCETHEHLESFLQADKCPRLL